MAMYNCKNKCLCYKCIRILKNCAECRTSVEKTEECLKEGIKKCKNFIPEQN